MNYKYESVDAPVCPGWWWCFPIPECEWYERHKAGLVCNIEYDDGISFHLGKYFYQDPRLYVMETFGTNSRGFSDLKYSDELVGKWYGPIENPEGDVR